MKIINEFQKFIKLVQSDLSRYYSIADLKGEKKIKKRKIVFEAFLFKAGFHAVFLYRFGYFLYRLGLNRWAWLVSRFNVFITGAEIEYNAEIGKGLMISHPVGIVIGRGSKIGERVTIFQGVTLGVRGWGSAEIHNFPNLGNEVMVFAGAKILGGVKVEDRSHIGANAVVLSDVPADSLAVGVPAVIKSRKVSDSAVS